MKKIVLLLGLTILSFASFAQNVITENNGRVTIRNANDSILTQIDSVGSGAINASFNTAKSEIVVLYTDGSVLVKKADGTPIVKIMSPCADNAASAVWSGDSIIITTQANQTLTKNALEWRQ